jgi:hypothetical protein
MSKTRRGGEFRRHRRMKAYGADGKGKPCVKYAVASIQRNGSRPQGRRHAVARAHDIRRRLHRRARQAARRALALEVLFHQGEP